MKSRAVRKSVRLLSRRWRSLRSGLLGPLFCPISNEPWGVDDHRVVFVVGNGRSGTHWLGYILGSHPDARVTVEKPRIFEHVKEMALNPSSRARLLDPLVGMYRHECARTRERYYVDKSHPVLWFAEDLAARIPACRFVGIVRDPYQVIASMVRHGGVSGWTDRWREHPVPNAFLGIDEALVERYDGLSLVEKHAYRWRSHATRMEEIRSSFGDRVTIIEYDALQLDTTAVLSGLQRFLELERPFPSPEVWASSRDKWRSLLTPQDIERIRNITGVEPPSQQGAAGSSSEHRSA